MQKVPWILGYTKVILLWLIKAGMNKLPSQALCFDMICKWNQYAFWAISCSVCEGPCAPHNISKHNLYVLLILAIHPNITTHALESEVRLKSWTFHLNIHSFHYVSNKMKREDLNAQNRLGIVTATPNHVVSVAIIFKKRVNYSYYY